MNHLRHKKTETYPSCPPFRHGSSSQCGFLSEAKGAVSSLRLCGLGGEDAGFLGSCPRDSLHNLFPITLLDLEN